VILALLAACSGADPDDSGASAPEPLVLPADPAEMGVPVGVRTVLANDQTIEVWYPAPDAVAGEPTEVIDFGVFVSDEVKAVLGDIAFPPLPTAAVRDAPVRVPDSPYPVVVFSHGFGGVRVQSVDITVHLASRGYVVVAADHPGRMMTDLLPCLFSPALEGCDLSGMTGDDPAVEDVGDVADWLGDAQAEGDFAGTLDLDHLVMTGHSAGGGTTQAILESDPRFGVGISFAAGAAPDSEQPLLLMGGSCDAFADDASMQSARDAVEGHGTLVQIADAGHLAFSDLCELELLELAETVLEPRDDVNQLLLGQLVALASDGCPEAVPDPALEACGESYLPIEVSDPIVRHMATVFLDQQVRGEGDGVVAGAFAEATVR